jgi:hypothetical protein
LVGEFFNFCHCFKHSFWWGWVMTLDPPQIVLFFFLVCFWWVSTEKPLKSIVPNASNLWQWPGTSRIKASS